MRCFSFIRCFGGSQLPKGFPMEKSAKTAKRAKKKTPASFPKKACCWGQRCPSTASRKEREGKSETNTKLKRPPKTENRGTLAQDRARKRQTKKQEAKVSPSEATTRKGQKCGVHLLRWTSGAGCRRIELVC